VSDFDCCVPVGPDCRDGKHDACDGRALDEHTDDVTACSCACHAAAARAARLSAADHAGRAERVEAVTRDLLADLDYYGERDASARVQRRGDFDEAVADGS